MEGLDISDYNVVDSFHDVAGDGISFIFSKATQGANFVAGSFLTNRQRIAEVPALSFGAYHFFDWGTSAPKQAQYFLSVYTPKKGDLPPMLDIEAIPDTMDNDTASYMVADFVDYVEKQLSGTKMFLYMNWDTINRQAIHTSWFAGHPLWLAMYGDTYSIPQTWTTPTIWQYAQYGQVAGVYGTVDRDKALVDLRTMRLG